MLQWKDPGSHSKFTVQLNLMTLEKENQQLTWWYQMLKAWEDLTVAEKKQVDEDLCHWQQFDNNNWPTLFPSSFYIPDLVCLSKNFEDFH